MTAFDRSLKTGHPDVPGASLYHEVAGSGPVLLLIPGGAADAGDFARIIAPLSGCYSVVMFDPRGISRSRLTDTTQDLSVDVLADDAHRVLEAIGAEPAYVLGSSSGGIIGLASVDRHPEAVHTLVAHEPPLVSLLPPGTPGRSSSQVICDAYWEGGVGPAIQKFMDLTGLIVPGPGTELAPDLQEAMAQRMARMQQNVEFFLAHSMLPAPSHYLRPRCGQVARGVAPRSCRRGRDLGWGTGPRHCARPDRSPGKDDRDLPWRPFGVLHASRPLRPEPA